MSAAIDKQNELMGFKIQRVESKRVDEFANMSDEELRQYVYGNKELDLAARWVGHSVRMVDRRTAVG